MDAKTDLGVLPVIGIIMGSNSDWKTMQPAAQVLESFGVPYETKVVSAHRTPDYLFEYANEAEKHGLGLIIAGAGGAAHLPGMAAAKTVVPVIGVPVVATPLGGLDALLSIMQMPAEVGVATVGVGQKGAKDAAWFAVAALASTDLSLRAKVFAHYEKLGRSITLPKKPPRVAILKDNADLTVSSYSEEYLAKLGIEHETIVLDVDGKPGGLTQQLADLEASGTVVFIAISDGGIDFACEVAKATVLPVLGVPTVRGEVRCVDEFLRPFLDMPPGVATFAIGKPGAINAALFAGAIIGGNGSDIWKTLDRMRDEQEVRVRAMTLSAV